MIPLSDENPTLDTPVMTWALLGAMFAVWLAVQGAGFDELQLAKSICNYGMVPGELTHRAALGLRVPIARGLYCVVDNDPIKLEQGSLDLCNVFADRARHNVSRVGDSRRIEFRITTKEF